MPEGESARIQVQFFVFDTGLRDHDRQVVLRAVDQIALDLFQPGLVGVELILNGRGVGVEVVPPTVPVPVFDTITSAYRSPAAVSYASH